MSKINQITGPDKISCITDQYIVMHIVNLNKFGYDMIRMNQDLMYYCEFNISHNLQHLIYFSIKISHEPAYIVAICKRLHIIIAKGVQVSNYFPDFYS